MSGTGIGRGLRIVASLPQILFGKSGGFVGGYVNSAINTFEVLQHHCDLTLVAGLNKSSDRGFAELRERLPKATIALLPISARASTGRYFVEFTVRLLQYCLLHRSSAPDFLLGHSGHAAYASITWAAAKLLRATPVHVLYCPISEEFHERKQGRAEKLLAQFGLTRVSTVAISDNIACSVQVLTNGPKPTVIRPAIREADILSSVPAKGVSTQLTLGFVGHDKPEKGFDLALQAVAALQRTGKAAQLVAVMSGEHPLNPGSDQTAQMLAELNLKDCVQVVRGIGDMNQLYDRLDLLLVPFRGTRGPSDYPMVLLEGLSRGLVVVGTGVGAVPEVLEHGKNGYLAAEVTTEKYVAAVLEAATAGEATLARLREEALMSARKFRASLITAQLLEHLQRIGHRRKQADGR